MTQPPVEPRMPRADEGDLLASVCHDLNEPLASILMGTGFLRGTLASTDGSARRVVETIHRAATRMGQRISSFSDLARLEAGDLRLEIGPHDPAAVTQVAFEELKPVAQGRQVSASLDLSGLKPSLRVSCDRPRLLQIFRNLWACALHLSPAGAAIVMKAAYDGAEEVRFGVTVRRPSTSRPPTVELPKPELALASGLIDLHGGRLAIERDDDTLDLSFCLPAQRVQRRKR